MRRGLRCTAETPLRQACGLPPPLKGRLGPIRLQGFPQRPHGLPRNKARHCTRQFLQPLSQARVFRKHAVGADAHIGPNPPQAGLIVAGAQAARVSGRPCRPPLRCRLFTIHYSLFTIHFSTPPSRLRRATSPKSLRALGEALPCVRRVRSGIAAMRTRDARPYGENGCPGRNVEADAYIGPKREAASHGGCGGCERPFVPPP